MERLTGLSKGLVCTSIMAAFIFSTGCVTTKKDLDPIQSDLQTIRQQLVKTQEDLTTLRQDMAKESSKQVSGIKTDLETIQKNQADSKTQVDKLSQDISITNNRLDENADRMTKLEQRIGTAEQSMTQKLDMAKAEIQKKVDALEQRLNTGLVPAPGDGISAQSTTGTNPVELVDPKQLYATAEQDYLKGQYELSINESKDYMQRFPNGAQIASSRFLLAQSYLALQRFDEALSELSAFISTYPNDERVPAAMLKRAFVYKQQKKVPLQQDELRALVKKYPLSPEAEQALDELKAK